MTIPLRVRFPHAHIAPFAAMLSIAAVVPSSAQELVVPEGSRVRVSFTNIDQGTPDWLVGHVVQTMSGNRLELLPEGREQPTTVLMDESTRLQIYRGRKSNFRLGAGIGGGVGALVGGLFFSEGFGGIKGPNSSFEWTQSALVFGAAGATAGLVFAFIRGQDRWDDRPLQDGRVPIPPLTLSEPANTVSRRSIQRWERFDPNEDNFAAFFKEHVSSLHPMEGVWEMVAREGTPLEEDRRFAVVRDARYEGFEYVAVRFVWREGFSPGERSGSIFAAVKRDDEPGRFRVISVGSRADRSALGSPAFLTGPAFIIQLDGTRPVEQWFKILP